MLRISLGLLVLFFVTSTVYAAESVRCTKAQARLVSGTAVSIIHKYPPGWVSARLGSLVNYANGCRKTAVFFFSYTVRTLYITRS